MDEYSKATLKVLEAFMENRIINEEQLESIEHMNYKEVIANLGRMNMEKLANALAKKDYVSIEMWLVEDIFNFTSQLRIYLKGKVDEVLGEMVKCYLDFIKRKLAGEEVDLCIGETKGELEIKEFRKKLRTRIVKESSGISEEEEEVLLSLLELLFDEEGEVEENNVLSRLVGKKIKSNIKLMKILNKKIIEERVWKGELFAK